MTLSGYFLSLIDICQRHKVRECAECDTKRFPKQELVTSRGESPTRVELLVSIEEAIWKTI